MKDLSIEYAHIYSNSKISREQEVSIKALNDVVNGAKDKSFSLVVLVDDYSFPDPTFDYGSFIEWLLKQGFKPDLILRESQLIPLCDEVLKKLNDVLKEKLVDYIKAKKYPCSLFIASWYLLRLGYLSSSLFPKELTAKQLINILPESFTPFEGMGLNIMANTDFTGSEKLVHNHYFEGRLLA